jgi:NADH-quinone oxidoreductase subunit K
MMSMAVPLMIASALFAIGTYAVLARRNAVLVLMGVELMLNAVNLLLVTFDVHLRDAIHSGQALTLFVITIAAAEIGLGLAIVLAVFRGSQTIDLDLLRTLADHDDGPDGADRPAEDAEPDRGDAGDPVGAPAPGSLR